MDPLSYPLEPPPPGATTDFGARGLQPTLIATHAVFLSLMILVLILRVHVRGFVIKAMWWEDYLALLAAAVIIVNSGIILALIPLGFGKHIWDIRLLAFLSSTTRDRLLSASGLPYPLAILLIKLSVAVLYWRILNIASLTFRLATRAIMIFCTVFYLGNFAYNIVTVVVCSNFYNGLHSPICSKGQQIDSLILGIGNVVTDVYLLLLPVPAVIHLRLGTNEKVKLWFMFTAGGLAMAASVARLVVTVIARHSSDFLYVGAIENIPTTIELCLGVIAASLPTLGKLPESHFFQSLSSKMRSYTSFPSLKDGSEKGTSVSSHLQSTEGKGAFDTKEPAEVHVR